MSRDDAELDALLSAMRDGPVALSSTVDAEARRERLLPALRAVVRAEPLRRYASRKRRTLVAASGAVALAAAAVLALVQLRAAREDVAVMEPLRVEPLGAEAVTWIDADGARSTLPVLTAVSTPGELVAPESSWSRVSTQRGVRVELAPRTRLRVTAAQARAAGPGLRLERGEVRCRVPKLGDGEQFSIATPDAQVIVHGTLFSVRFGEPQQETTCVRVTEGLVEVRHDGEREFLGPGMAWGCVPAPVAGIAPADRTDGAEKLRAGASRAAKAARRRVPDAPREAGTLDEENALLAAALGAERAHDPERARTLFSKLLGEHPDSPLAPEARAGLARSR